MGRREEQKWPWCYLTACTAVRIAKNKRHPVRVAFCWSTPPVKLVYKGKVAGDEIKFEFGTEDGAWGTQFTAKKA
jgi:hypothetical protein